MRSCIVTLTVQIIENLWIYSSCISSKIHKTSPHFASMTTCQDDRTSRMFSDLFLVMFQDWEFLVPMSQLQAGYRTSCHNYFNSSNSDKTFTHIRLNIYPGTLYVWCLSTCFFSMFSLQKEPVLGIDLIIVIPVKILVILHMKNNFFCEHFLVQH